MMAGIAMGRDESETMKRIETAKHLADRQRMESLAGNNPDYILENMKTPADMKRLFPNSIPADFAYIKGLAIGQKNFFKQQEDAALSSFYEDVSQKAEDGMPYEQMRRLIINQPGLTKPERDKAMMVFNSAANTWQQGGTKENPWKSTQNYNALMEMQIKISSGQPVTEMDIINAQMAQPEKGPLFSNSDRNNLFGQLPDSKDPSMRTPVSKQWLADVDDMFMDDKGLVKPEDREAWMKIRNGVTEIIRTNHPDVGKTQKEIDAFLKPAKKEKTKGLLSRLLTVGSPLGIAEGITGLGGLTSPAKMLFRGFPKSAPIHVDTLDQAEKLKQGQKFEYQGKVYTRK
jgi:hypothetical protein